MIYDSYLEGSVDYISISSLTRVPAIEFGLARLKQAIREANRVFCVCSVGRNYHVGAQDAQDTFKRAIDRGQLVARSGGCGQEDTIFIPVDAADNLASELDEQIAKTSEEIESVYDVLRAAYPEYDTKVKRLNNQKGNIHKTFLMAFDRLAKLSLLPVTVGSSAFNHQGMTLLMRECFNSTRDFIAYLQNPEILRVNEDSHLSKMISERLKLLKLRSLNGELTPDQLERYNEVTEFIRSNDPVFTPKDFEPLEDMAVEITRMKQSITDRRRKFREEFGLGADRQD